MNREDIELYVSGNFDGDVAALERAIGDDPALAEQVADEARFELLLRDAAAAATFCPACADLVRGERCDACGAAVRPGGYVVERVLVSNAHGRMYVARDADGKHVALKELAFVQAPTVATIEAFEREARFLRALEHPAIPRFVASFEEGSGVHARYYLAQELVEGTALDRLDDHWYTETEIVDIARQVLAILVYLQGLSPMVIHRDIKPANLIKRDDGSIALVDFGAAYVHGSTAGVTTVGTFGYMPVEQLAGIVDATTDLYALGASLVYLLTRQEPWKLAQQKTVLNVSAPLRGFLDRLVAADPRTRFASAKDALAALDRREAPRVRRTGWVRSAALAAAGVALAASGVGVYHFATTDEPRRERTVAPAVVPAGTARLRIALPAGTRAELVIDGRPVGPVEDGAELPVSAGTHDIELRGQRGARCKQELRIVADKTTTIECIIAGPARAEQPRLDLDHRVSWSYKSTPLDEVLAAAAKTCGFSVVAPDHLDVKITAELSEVACNHAVETILEAQGLGYVYEPSSKLVRVGPRRALEAEREAAALRTATQTELPDGTRVSLDFKDASIRDLLKMLAQAGGDLNLVLPDHIDGKLTIRLADVPWHHAFEAVLDAHGLWYRYRPESKILRIAPRRELDAEDEARRP